ncbi:protein CFAP20DC [Biomphalaria pfeifferi]|uniref:Protein CFAP20DC n=1 Tax=Biomphalaria pfeifferi TaxID=112525 RepID=A0AAD8C0Y7_BIOPF|nr:protein CFAP20DC [Biomphalaria pfeifferi]
MSFKSGYQGGPYYELLSTQGKDSLSNWKVSNSGIKKIYDKEVKGYILTLEGASATTKVQTPKDQKLSLTLIQRYIVLQIYLPKGADFSMEFGITDLGNNKRRILLSTSQKEIQVTPLHAKVPLAIVHKAIWLNLALDLMSLVGDMWIGQTFRSLDQITISANCKLRRVFTMKSQPPDTTEDEELDLNSTINTGEIDNIPKHLQLTLDVEQHTQVLNLSKIKSAERIKSGKGLADQNRSGSMLDLDLSSSGRKVQLSDGKIAFGSKAPRAPDTGRKTSRQGNVTNRSFKSQISKNDATDGQDDSEQVDIFKQSHPGSAGSASSLSYSHQPHPGSAGSVSSLTYSHQASDSDGIANGMKDLQLVAPHPPREPSNDRVRRKPRIKLLAQNGLINKGESSLISPPTSATLSGPMRKQRVHMTGSVTATTILSDTKSSQSSMKDSGVGPDVPEIQSPRKGEKNLSEITSNYDSVADVISLLREVEEKHIGQDSGEGDNNNNSSKLLKGLGNDVAERERKLKETSNDCELNPEGKVHFDEDDSNKSTSESSHPGEYEESDDETSGDNNKLHHFFSPPKSASLRRTASPITESNDLTSLKKSASKMSKRSADSVYRGARLEDDFVSHSSSEEDPALKADMLHHTMRQRRPVGSAGSTHSDGKVYNSSNYSTQASYIKLKSQANNSLRSRPATNLSPKGSTSPDQKPSFNSRKERDSVTRMSKKSVREINNPVTYDNEQNLTNGQRPYDATKYRMEEVTDSFEARMYESMRRHADESLQSLSPTLDRLQHRPSETTTSHIHCESPATTSDDDTSFSSWKAPNLNQVPHNYQDEMKSQRSSDTLTSSNPRDWSGVMSPPIVPLSRVQDLQGTMEGLSDDLSDDPMTNHGHMGQTIQNTTEDDKLDLLFDPKLNCYYDPETKKYYELVT